MAKLSLKIIRLTALGLLGLACESSDGATAASEGIGGGSSDGTARASVSGGTAAESTKSGIGGQSTAAGSPSGGGGVSPVLLPQTDADCSKEPHFECGWEAVCEKNVISAKWHVHTSGSSISDYRCKFQCPEECDPNGLSWPSSGAELVASACVEAGAGARRAFVTSTESTGDFGGVTAGDAICQALADANSLGGDWKAWLSDSSTSPSTTFTRPRGGYVDMSGEPLGGWSDAELKLTDMIWLDEKGAAVSAWVAIWTGTDARGEATDSTCDGWRSTNEQGTVGLCSIFAQWTEADELQDCSRTARLYCFEQ